MRFVGTVVVVVTLLLLGSSAGAQLLQPTLTGTSSDRQGAIAEPGSSRTPGLAGTSPGVLSGLSSFFPLRNLDVGGWKILPSIKVGGQRSGTRFNVPVPFLATGGNTFLDVSPIDLKVDDTSSWTGGARIEIQGDSGLGIFLCGLGNPRLNTDVITHEQSFVSSNVIEPITWTGSGLEWWALEGGACFALTNGFAAIGGLRRDHLSLSFGNPRDPSGFFPPWAAAGLSWNGDLLGKTWIPYVGILVSGLNYSAVLLGSPFATAQVTLPVRFHDVGVIVGNETEARYSFNRPGNFLEASFEYRLFPGTSSSVALWGTASWLSIKGDGELDFTPDVALTPFDPLSRSATSTYSRYMLDLGLSAQLTF